MSVMRSFVTEEILHGRQLCKINNQVSNTELTTSLNSEIRQETFPLSLTRSSWDTGAKLILTTSRVF